MSKISIVFDRLRTEEKMLQKAAAELGHTAIMLDAKITQINTDSKKDDFDLGDVVLERCVSYFRGLHFTSALEFLDIPVLNKFDVASICGNKMFMTLLLKKNNIPTPKTYFSFSSQSAAENLEKVGYPLVIKPVIGSWGRGVIPIKDKDAMEAIFEIRDITDSPHDRIYYLQQIVKRPPRDIRIITIGDEAVAGMYRKSSGGFKTEIAQRARAMVLQAQEMEELAIKASKAIIKNARIIDMMEDEERGIVVHEVNNTVENIGARRLHTINIPKEIDRICYKYVKK